MKIAATLALLLLGSHASPCFLPPDGLFEKPKSLVWNTDTIVLAKAISFENNDGFGYAKVKFEAVRFLKGQHQGPIEVSGEVVTGETPTPNDFDGHHDPDFWAVATGNASTYGDCQAYGVFHIGESYLLFLRSQSNFKSFENIQSNDDEWLLTVERAVADDPTVPKQIGIIDGFILVGIMLIFVAGAFFLFRPHKERK